MSAGIRNQVDVGNRRDSAELSPPSLPAAFSFSLTFALGCAAVAGALVDLIGQTELAEWIVFMGSFVFLLPTSLVITRGLMLGSRVTDLEALTMAAVTGLTVVIVSSRLASALGSSSRAAALIVLAGLGLLALMLAGMVRSPISFRSGGGLAIGGVAAVLAAVTFAPPSALTFARLAFATGVAAAVAAAYVWVRPVSVPTWLLRVVDVVAPLLAVLVIVDLSGYETPIGLALLSEDVQWHHDFFLGPVDDVLHGSALLVDAACQYGVGSIYFLAGWFKIAPLGYGPMQLIAALLTAAQYGAAYVIMRFAGCGRLLAGCAALVAVGVTVLAAEVSQGPGHHPSVSGLRYLLPFVAILLIVRTSRTGAMTLTGRGTLAVTGLASLWSAETCAYTTAVVVMAVAADAVIHNDRGSAGSRFGKDLARILLSIAVAQIAFAVATRLLAGDWPDWGWYLTQIHAYSAEGFTAARVDRWSPVWPIAGVYFTALLGVFAIASIRRERASEWRTELLATAATATCGAAFLTYFVNRSVDSVLTLLALPVVMLAAIWLGVGLRTEALARRTRVALVAAAAWIAAFALAVGSPMIAKRWPRTALAHAVPGGASFNADLSRLWSSPLIDPRAPEVERMLNQYFPRGDRSAVLIEPDLQIEGLVRSGRADALPVLDPAAGLLAPDDQNSKLVNAVANLRSGTPLLLQRHPPTTAGPQQPTSPLGASRASGFVNPTAWLTPLEARGLAMIKARFDLQPVATGSYGLTVVRLERRTNTGRQAP